MYRNENEAYAGMLCGHLRDMTERLRLLPAHLWDWAPAPPAPTARILTAHTWQWLVCDRQHLAEPDARRHPLVPAPPADPKAMCDLLAEETERWQALILSLTPEQLDAPRLQFNGRARGVRNFVCHMVQNSIYKHGQLTTLFFALGLDGDGPYTAPFPNDLYQSMRDADPSI
ncbi:MAG: DinB family protein [Armatimonadetes bacterium]|nr:DinB family protein [Armatimonadota bacterium]